MNLADGTITVRASKTDAGTRRVDVLPALRDELATYKAGVIAHPDARVFPTSTGGPLNPSNARNRILKPSIERANKRLVKAGLVPLPQGLSPHKLTHTDTSLMAALGTDPGEMMDQLGHTNPGFTFSVYRHAMRRDQASKDRLKALVGETQPESSGTISGTTLISRVCHRRVRARTTPQLAGSLWDHAERFDRADLLRAKLEVANPRYLEGQSTRNAREGR